MTTLTCGRSMQFSDCLPKHDQHFFSEGYGLQHRSASKALLRLLLLLALFIGAPLIDIRGQVTSPCDCETFSPIGEDNTETIYDELVGGPFTTNRCYLVSGTLVIDGSDPLWNSIRIRMDEGAAIRVESNLTMWNTHISGCDDMWVGIRTEPYANLIVNSCILEDASLAIHLSSFTEFHCENTDFINDYIGIAAGSPFDELILDVQILQKGDIFGCRFFTEDNLPPPYPGHFYDPDWPTSTIVPYDQGYAAVYIEGAAGLNIGFTGAEGSDRNKIYQMRNGILLQYAIADIAGTDFYDFEGNIGRISDAPSLDLNQFGVHSFFAASNIEDNTVVDIMIGIKADLSFQRIYGNLISVKNDPGVHSRTRGISISRPQTLNVENNSVTDGYHGIEVLNAVTSFNIRSNTLDRQISAGHNAGISVVGSMLPDLNLGVVKGNTIDVIDGTESFGIHIMESRRILVDGNNINYMEDDGVGDVNRGISVDGSTHSFIQRNDVFADPDYMSAASDNMAIEFFDASLSRLHCNSTENFETNNRFLAPCTETRVTSNSIYDALFGLTLTGYVALGTQRHHANVWHENPYSEFGAFIDAPDPAPTAFASKFYFDVGDNADYEPDPIGPSIIDNGSWFVLSTNPNVELTCITPMPDPLADSDTLSKLLLAEYELEEFNDQMVWTLKADIFEMMLLDPTLNADEVLDSFFDVEKTNPLGKLILWQLKLSSRFGEEVVGKTLTQDTIWQLSRDLVYIDSILALKPVDSLTWMALRELKVDTLNTEIGEWVTHISDENAFSIDTFTDIADDLDNLVTGNDMEEYLRLALLFKTQYLLGDDFTSGDSTDIYDLTQLCPWEGGRAITIGRELYRTIVDSSYVVTLVNCPEPEPFAIKPNHINPHTDPSVVVTPNPSAGNINISVDGNIREVIVSSSTSEHIANFFPQMKRTQLSLNHLADGMYIITVITDAGISTQRIMLIR